MATAVLTAPKLPEVMGIDNFQGSTSMIRENRQLVTDESVEFEKQPVAVQDCRENTDHFRGICRIYPNLVKENRRMSTCKRLDLQTLGSQPVMQKNCSDHCSTYHTTHWPREDVDFAAKRLAGIGTGSSGVQSIPILVQTVARMIHSKLCSITPVATKVHVILQSFLVLTWMCDIIDLV